MIFNESALLVRAGTRIFASLKLEIQSHGKIQSRCFIWRRAGSPLSGCKRK
jgi:hypothetical protein